MLKTKIAGFVLAGGVLLSLGGCPGVDPLLTGLAKIASGNIQTLTVAEVQNVAIWAEQQAGVQQMPLTEEEAQAVLWFLEDNNINTIEDVSYLVHNPQEVIISEDVAQVVGKDRANQVLAFLGQSGV
ncbi:MAG: hypothetical protein KBH81_06465 [Phycisphaerae bacterium]|jgi:hypothetical protein|nr:hypothetical protein [Phycisphaerae bacterium]HOO17897.1 hypothetical protein [Phycisphaerae bacterium]HPC21651.1 hypothetical protein [Phycisphaerae bacterium]HRS26861.1 hypothetical protein [Phycisphaerae bacterium]HRT42008.1 hypothetical protein [Phycisphaerae bacterium]